MAPYPPVHLELPALPAPPAGGAGVAESWWGAVEVAAGDGAQGLWFSGGPGSGPGRWCDPVVLAAGAVPIVARSLLGVVSPVPAGRHPAVLAREVTGLDVVSRGRAAVLLTCRSAKAGDPADDKLDASDACELMTEAAAVCRAVLSDESPVFEGQYFHVAGAVNRPGSVRPGGPPLLVEVPPGWGELVDEDDAARDLGARLASAASAVVCAGGPGELVACRRALGRFGDRIGDQLGDRKGDRIGDQRGDLPVSKTAGDSEVPTGLWWRGPAAAAESTGYASAFEESRVDGLLLQLPPPGPGEPHGGDLAHAVEAVLNRTGWAAC